MHEILFQIHTMIIQKFHAFFIHDDSTLVHEEKDGPNPSYRIDTVITSETYK